MWPFLLLAFAAHVGAFSMLTPTSIRQPSSQLFAQRKSSESSNAVLLEQEETPANIPGNEFFGGNRQKEELYDPVAEEAAVITVQKIYNKFDDTAAFDGPIAKSVAQSLQHVINTILYEEEKESDIAFEYEAGMTWESPFGKTSPLEELEKSLEFYNRLDVAIISGKTINDNTVELVWEISVAWPILWEPRVVITGTSVVNLRDNKIVKQVDRLDQPDLLSTIASQVLPRFWDTYHIGMTPSAELAPRRKVNTGFLPKPYQVYEIMPRLVYKPTRLDTTNNREDAFAQVIPNHAFCTLIKTMGPKRQRYIPASPVEVQLSRTTEGDTKISWRVPISVELQTNSILPLPGDDPETLPEAKPTAEYVYEGKRQIATIPYGGAPQDEEVTAIRRKLYEQVIRDNLKPKLDETGRPQFFFLQNNAKACYTEGGLGMGVYDWRPPFVKANEVGIELELQKEGLAAS
jgi:hypothetical protein